MSDMAHWERRYRDGDSPWDTGRPSSELMRVVTEVPIRPCRAIDLGCGTGTSAVWLAQNGFEVTAVDLSPLALERAKQRAAESGVSVRCLAADLLNLAEDLGGPFDFFFDRGCYHVVRRVSAAQYVQSLLALTRPGTVGLVLAGNAREAHSPGPPVVTEEEIRGELGQVFTIEWLREFRFDQLAGSDFQPLAWSCLLRRH
jgi:2-polyprenyl-3-methyl-5-hydroxy-6-metoxy-1,4-benzoquinol methylase